VLPIPGLDGVPYFTNESIFDDLPAKPESLLILGGGPIGCEFAQVMSRLGVDVTLVELTPRILPRDDREASTIMAERFRAEGIEVLAGTQAVRFEKQDGKVLTHLQKGGTKRTRLTQALLVATGRRPNTDGLGLEEAGVKYDGKRVNADAALTTSQSHIFACGDIVGPYQFTHTADYQARIVVRNILFPWKKAKADYRWVPWVTYTDPEVAHVGMTQEEAKKNKVACSIHRFDWNGLDRAITDGEETGFIKVLTPPGKDKILGATVVGVHGGDVLHELVVAGKHGIGLSRLSATIHAYPTLSQSVQRVGDAFQKTKLTPRVAAIIKWLYRRRRS
jgi:pyruvate/2-oxoglutarate dehydrogenase complex dihydrolipoamide dehydrogenase (E3) component